MNGNGNGVFAELTRFLKTARHLWGRCPSCGSFFRVSDAAISSTSQEPKDWLRNFERRNAELMEKEENLDTRETDLSDRDAEVRQREREVLFRENRLERDAKTRVREILRSKTEIQALIRQASKEAVLRSRQTLLGRMLERIAPCFRQFHYDPRDMRSICDPMDFVLFDGLTVERQVKQITFIEVKCGRSRLTGVQRSVREAVDKGRVHAEVWEIGDRDIPITKHLDGRARRALPPAE